MFDIYLIYIWYDTSDNHIFPQPLNLLYNIVHITVFTKFVFNNNSEEINISSKFEWGITY